MAEDEFNIILRQEREKQQWTQEELAETLGTTRANISRWETGTTYPNFYYRKKICKLFNKNPEDLGLFFTRKREDNHNGQISNKGASQIKVEAITSSNLSVQTEQIDSRTKRIPPLPLSYRAELLKPLLSDAGAGECCSLVSMGGTGKSNLGRFLERLDVQQAYWQDNLSWAILIDFHGLIFSEEKLEYSFIELLIQRLIATAEKRDFASEFIEWANALCKPLEGNTSTRLAFRLLQELCKRLCEHYGLQLIFIFDQFDDLWKMLNAHIFLNLRELRDQFEYQIVYIVMTRERLQELRQDSQATEAFWELFSTHTYCLGPYSEEDAVFMVERLASRASIAAHTVPKEVIVFSGRHPGLLRAIFWAFRNASFLGLTIDGLLSVPSVHGECAKIWQGFSQQEQHVVQIIAQKHPIPHAFLGTLRSLQFKKIISGDPPALFSPLFSAYVLHDPINRVPGVVVDIGLRQVFVDGLPISQKLSHLEFTLLAYLAHHSGSVCTYEALIRTLYNESHYDKSDQRIPALLKRLRDALGDDAQVPRYIMTHRGEGIQLLWGTIIDRL